MAPITVKYAAGYGFRGAASEHTTTIDPDDLPEGVDAEAALDAIHREVLADIGRNMSPHDLVENADDLVAQIVEARRPAAPAPTSKRAGGPRRRR